MPIGPYLDVISGCSELLGKAKGKLLDAPNGGRVGAREENNPHT
ncbi:MAG: hypothetical protein QOG15_728 [Solirubrobacteraceae bacterium]|jgi:hypothetical protein|nr:hypothetical protein [Solirubrobacteraceae bacterium]